jgi:regulator of sirC expression with transglutaminase-like and TPR domain
MVSAADIARWTDARAIEAWLAAEARRPDADLDLAGMALALAALAQPGKSATPHVEHLAAMVSAAAAVARPNLPPAAQAAVIEAVLFDKLGYRGDGETYDDLANADLMSVIERRRGLPITLSILYIHTARGLGWSAEGVNFPGHFLVRVGAATDALIVDPFDRGAIRAPDELEAMLRGVQGRAARLAPEHVASASNRDILLRLQNNIKVRCLKRQDAAGALGAVERMAMVAPKHPGLWYDAATLNAELGQLQRARACLDAVSRLDTEGRLTRQAETLRNSLRTRLN